MKLVSLRKFSQILIILGLAWLLTTPNLALAQVEEGGYSFRDSSGLNITGDQAGYKSDRQVQPEDIIGRLVKTILSFVGVIFFAFVIYGGIIWMTAQGDDTKSGKAKGIIETATVGLIIIVAAYALTLFIINRLNPSSSLASTEDFQKYSNIDNDFIKSMDADRASQERPYERDNSE